MNILVITGNTSTGNIVRGALQQAQVPVDELHIKPNANDAGALLTDDTVVLVDWDGDPEVNAGYVQRIRDHEAGKDTPILLLCAKQQSGTIFAGMKAGANGVVGKPLDPQEMVRNIASARKSVKGRKPTINVEFINPFIEATRTVLKTMAGLDVERKRLFLKNDYKMFGDISGVMGLSGEASGSVVISLPANLATFVVGKMLGDEPRDELSPEVCDGVGELINMISGQAKASLTKTKYHFQISIPTVVTGDHHEIRHKQGTPNIVVLFETAAGEAFAIQVCLSPREDD